MFRNKEIRKFCEQPLDYYNITVQTHVEISATLNSFREIYNGFYRWSNTKFLTKLKEKWKIVETIQNNHVTKLFNKNEAIKSELEKKSLLDKSKVEIVETTQVNEPKVVPISPDIEEYNLIDKNKVEIMQQDQGSIAPSKKTILWKVR